jgi:hypothetical protein
MPGHFTTLWKSQSTSTLSGQLAREAVEYYYSARAESVKWYEIFVTMVFVFIVILKCAKLEVGSMIACF